METAKTDTAATDFGDPPIDGCGRERLERYTVPPASDVASKVRVLVASMCDDARVIEKNLACQGVLTRMVTSAHEALVSLIETPVDVVLVDTTLPDAVELVTRITSEHYAHAVIALRSQRHARLQPLRDAGCLVFITTPCSTQLLLRAIRQASTWSTG